MSNHRIEKLQITRLKDFNYLLKEENFTNVNFFFLAPINNLLIRVKPSLLFALF